MSKSILWLIILSTAASAITFDLSGHYKNLFTVSKTPLNEPYNFDLNRLRLQVKSQVADNLSTELQYDLEAYLGTLSSYTNTNIYRAYFTYAFPGADLRVGRQKIPWGVGRVWNPTDPFNPIDFTSLEREERAGVDALSLDLALSPLAGMNIVYAAGKTAATFGGRLRTNVSGLDLSLIGVRPGEDYLLGFDFAGQLFDAGVRGEAAYARAATGEAYPRYVLGYDYTFPNSLYFLSEYYFNGQTGSSYGFLGLTYDIFSMLKGGGYFLYNIADGSFFANPFLDYALTENSSWAVGSYILGGGAGSEFGAFSNVYYAQIKWYF